MGNKRRQEKKPAQRSTALWRLLRWGVALLLLTAPFINGLFQDRDQLTLVAWAVLLFAIACIAAYSENTHLLHIPLDYAAIAIPTVYIISAITPVYFRSALQSVLIYSSYFMLYWVVSRSCVNSKHANLLLRALTLAGTGAALLGLAALVKVIDRPEFLASYRVCSTYQYPNTFAALLTLCFFGLLALALTQQRAYQQLLNGACGFTILVTFLLTYSRGAWLVFPAACLVALTLLPNERKAQGLLIAALWAVLAVFNLRYFSRMELTQQLKLYFPISLVVAALGTLVIHLLFTHAAARKWVNRAVAGAVVLCVVLGSYAALEHFYLAPQAMQQKLDHNLMANSNMSRDFDLDGVADGFTAYIHPQLSAELSVDSTAQAQKIEILSSTSRDAASVSQEIIFQDLENFSAGVEYRTQGDVEAALYVFWYKDTQYLGRNNTPYSQSAEFTRLVLEDIAPPEGSNRAIVRAYLRPAQNEATGVGWFRRAMLAPAAALGEYVATDKEPTLIDRFIPSRIRQRFEEIDVTTHSASTRVLWSQDALKIVKDYPFFGIGGGGWESAYYGYQSYLYWTKYVHNDFAQMWAEAGTIGLLAYVAFLAMLVIGGAKTYWKARTAQRSKMILLATLGAGVLAYTAHSLIELNAAFVSTGLVFWVVIGILGSLIKPAQEPDTVTTKKRFALPAAAGYSFVVFIAVVMLALGGSYARAAQVAMAQGHTQAAVQFLNTAISFDPWNAEYHRTLGEKLLELYSQTGNRQLLQLAEQHAAKAKKLQPTHPSNSVLLGNVFFNQGEIEGALNVYQRAIELQPYNVKLYELKLQKLEYLGTLALQSGSTMLAQEYYDECKELLDLVEERAHSIREEYLRVNRQPERLRVTPYIRFILGKIAYHEGEYGLAAEHFMSARGDRNVRNYAEIYLAAAYCKLGDEKNSARWFSTATKAKPELEELYNRLIDMPSLGDN